MNSPLTCVVHPCQACGQVRTLEARGRSLDTQLHEVTEELYATHAEVRASTVSTHYQRCR